MKIPLVISALLFGAIAYGQVSYQVPEAQLIEQIHNEPIELLPTLTPRQEEWLSLLELCESGGNHNAINQVDLDGTASYSSFQFKPGTLYHYVTRYDVLPDIESHEIMNVIMDYFVQRATVEQMILHRDEINWYNEFPACVAKLGLPPPLH